MPKKKRVLILCTGNSCRSQMAEGVLRHYGGHRFVVLSAGTRPTKINETAIYVMQEIGIDISGQQSKHVDEFRRLVFDYIITVCDNARETCPVFYGNARRVHWSFPDPAYDDEPVTEDVLARFREIRDLIHAKFRHVGETGCFD